MKRSTRLEKIPPYLFAEVDRRIAEKKSSGVDVISFGVGDPDTPTPRDVVNVLAEEAAVPENQQYPSYFGLPEFRRAAASWFRRRFSVELDPDREILPLIGSKEGIAHLGLALLDPGDIALVPEPSYPVYSMGALLAGAEPGYLPLSADNGFLPRLQDADPPLLERARLLWLNYPNNPTGAVAGTGFFEEVIDFAKTRGIVLAHDNAYSEITFDGFVAPSMLQFEGGKEAEIEFHSLSKTFNMSGWRIGFACGNREVIEALGVVKTNIDSGIFNPIQLAGVRALDSGEREVARMRELYRRRRDTAVERLKRLGFRVKPPKGGIYIWLPVPDGFDSVGFSTHVLEEAGVFFTPGNAYGPSGEGFVRLALTVPDHRIAEAMARLEKVFGP